LQPRDLGRVSGGGIADRMRTRRLRPA